MPDTLRQTRGPVLYLAHRFPFPPAGGAKVRAFHSIRRLLDRGERVAVAAPLRDAREEEAVAPLEAMGVEVLAERVHPAAAMARCLARAACARPASMGYFRSPALLGRLRAWIAERRPELIVVHCSSVAPYVAGIADMGKILDFVDMDSCKWLDYAGHARFPLSAGYRWEGRNLARAEAALARRFDLCLVATEHERESLREIAGPVASAVVRNGVDVDYFSPGSEPCDPDLIAFVGRMDYYPNVRAITDFCAQTLPLTRRVRPAVRLAVVGAAPTREVRALASIPGVDVTGTVDDVRDHVRPAALTVAPLAIARGTQNKILESMAMAVPVVASPIAARGVDAVADRHLLVARPGAETAEAVLALLGDPARRTALATAGRRHMERHYGWSRTLADFDRAVETVRRKAAERDASCRHP